MKDYKKTVILTTVITLLPILIGILLWNRLPDRIATHWGADGQPNGWSGKAFAVFGLPCVLAVIQLITAFVMLNDPKKKNIHKKALGIVLWIIPVLSFLVNGITYFTALGADINMTIVVCMLIGVLFIVLGNYMPKLRQNYTVGIRLPWTLNSEENWNRTHRLGGKALIIGGFLIILSGFFSFLFGDTAAFTALIVIALISAVVPSVYSYLLFRKGI